MTRVDEHPAAPPAIAIAAPDDSTVDLATSLTVATVLTLAALADLAVGMARITIDAVTGHVRR